MKGLVFLVHCCYFRVALSSVLLGYGTHTKSEKTSSLVSRNMHTRTHTQGHTYNHWSLVNNGCRYVLEIQMRYFCGLINSGGSSTNSQNEILEKAAEIRYRFLINFSPKNSFWFREQQDSPLRKGANKHCLINTICQ